MEGMEGVPPWLQVVISAGFFVGTAGVGLIGYLRRGLASKNDEQKTHDTVVISGDFADGTVIKNLLVAISEMNDANRELVDVAQRQVDCQSRTNDSVNRLNDSVVRLTDLVRDKLTK